MTLKTHSNLKTCSKSFEGKKKQRARAETMSKKTKTVMKTVIKTVGESEVPNGLGEGRWPQLEERASASQKEEGAKEGF